MQTPDPRCQWMEIKAQCSGNEIQLQFASCLSPKGEILPWHICQNVILRKINTRTYQPHLLIPYNNNNKTIMALIYILLGWSLYFNSQVFAFLPQIGFELDDTVEFQDSDIRVPTLKGPLWRFIPSQQKYKQEKSTFLETALWTRNSNTCGLCFSDTLGIELCGTLNPLSYKTGLGVALSVCHWHTESADFFHLCLWPVTLMHLNVLLIINKANITCTKVRESCKARLTTISFFPDTALYEVISTNTGQYDLLKHWNIIKSPSICWLIFIAWNTKSG